MQDFIMGMIIGVITTISICLVIHVCREKDRNLEFRGVAERIEIYEKYESGDLTSKKAASDVCSKILEDNGCVPFHVSSVSVDQQSGYYTYLRVVGTKNVVSSSSKGN